MDQPTDEQLKEAYERGKDHGANGYVRIPDGEWERIAYDLGWEDGADLTSNEQSKRPLADRIDSRFRAEHGVYE